MGDTRSDAERGISRAVEDELEVCSNTSSCLRSIKEGIRALGILEKIKVAPQTYKRRTPVRTPNTGSPNIASILPPPPSPWYALGRAPLSTVGKFRFSTPVTVNHGAPVPVTVATTDCVVRSFFPMTLTTQTIFPVLGSVVQSSSRVPFTPLTFVSRARW